MNGAPVRSRVSLLRDPMEYYRLFRRARKWRSLAVARRWIPRILADLPDAVRVEGTGLWKIHWITWTGSSALDTRTPPMGTRVVVAVGPEERPVLVIKLPSTDAETRGLRRQQHAMKTIRESSSIGNWRNLIPSSAHEGCSAGRTFFVEKALPGRSAYDLLDIVSPAELLCQAAREIRGMHECTGNAVMVDADAFRCWVSEPLDRLRRLVQKADGPRDWGGALDSLEDELHEALVGRVVWRSWIHGDFWLGNVLMEPNEGVTGLVDWDRAGPAEPAFQDVVHLLLVARLFARPTQSFFGEVVAAFLSGAVWTPDELQVLSEADLPFSASDARGQRALVLLCWIRRMLSDMDATDSPPGHLWITRNIDVVLEHAAVRPQFPGIPHLRATTREW
jgi:aminoglycoside phosphotransferase (APT) family kinase protein